MFTTRIVIPALLLLSSASALAQLVPSSAKPDPRIIGVSFGNSATTFFSMTGYAAVQVPPGAKVSGADPGTLCSYDMTVQSVNYGPGSLTAEDLSKLVVGVSAKLPDGSVVESQGKLCLHQTPAPVPGNLGCAGTETVILPAGQTTLTWTIDPANQLEQDYEDANVLTLVLDVPSPCTPKGEIALVKQPDAPAPQPARGIEAARERLSQGLSFTRAIKPSKAPPRSSRTPSSSPRNSRQPPQ